MSENHDRLRIHTSMAPASAGEQTSTEKIRWRCIPIKKKRSDKQLSFSDRLLRNSAIACAILLGVLSLGNIDHPIARSASESVRQVLSMHIDLDESIGQLSFVRNLMPESALVFLNMTDRNEFSRPSTGEITHPYSAVQPWLLFSCEKDQSVLSVADGIVTAVSRLSNGSYGLLIDHGSGAESVYAYLDSITVKPGESVTRAQAIGLSGETLYYELRIGEESADPGERMGL